MRFLRKLEVGQLLLHSWIDLAHTKLHCIISLMNRCGDVGTASGVALPNRATHIDLIYSVNSIISRIFTGEKI